MTQRESIINLYDSSKRPKYDYDLGDRISALPDSILGLILSFLPTKNAVATSILSKRWEFAWVTVHNLYFQYYRIEHNEGERLKFVGFVNRVLLLHDAGFLNKFTLIWLSGCISSHVHSWINTAFTKNVHELSLFLGADDREFEMPISVLNCSSLRSLELGGGISVSEANVFCLPSLETLILAVDFQSEKAFEKLISGSPMLNYLDLNRTHEDAIMCIISSTSLTHLELHLGSKCSLRLDTPSLEYLMVTGGISEIFVLKGLSSLVDVDIQIDYEADSHNSIVEAVRAFDRAKTLNLSHDVMRALHCATINLSTEFKRLVKLQTEMYFRDYMSLQDFLQSSTNLEVLTICQWNDENYISELSKWTTPVKVPRCLSNSLKKVVIADYNGLEDGPEMIRYMLKHGSVLESIKIYCDHCLRDNEKLKLLQEICKFSRKSTACEVEFLPFWDSEQGQGPDLKKRASL